MKRATTTAALVAGLLLATGSGTAAAKATDTAVLRCGSDSVVVSGFGRGQALHVVGGTSTFVVTFAQLQETGTVLADIPGQRDRRDVVSCTTVAPSGTAFVFRGFFTPRG